MAHARRTLFGNKRSRFIPLLLLAPGIFLYVLIAVGPSLATFAYSFTDATGLRGLTVNWIGFDNYDEFLFRGAASRDNIDALQRTLIFSFFVTAIQFGLGTVARPRPEPTAPRPDSVQDALLHARDPGSRRPGTDVETLPASPWRPGVRGVRLAGLESEFLGGQPNQAFAWVIVVQIWANVGITLVIFLAGMQTIDEELYQAARVDGASGWQLFRHITWPQLTPAVNTNFLLNVIGSLQAWQLFLVLVGYRPGTQVLGYLVFAEGFGQTGGVGSFRQGFAAAASIVLFMLVMILGTLCQLVRRLA
jgi:raffinose/stachyose/melibiose transport system permease protein